jgi:hypothetical protein
MNRPAMLRQPSAFLPVLLSAAALATVLTHAALYGAVREPDEGAAAHIFQLLMLAQLPIVAFFALKWIPREPRQGLPTLALQVTAALAAWAPVYYFHL